MPSFPKSAKPQCYAKGGKIGKALAATAVGYMMGRMAGGSSDYKPETDLDVMTAAQKDIPAAGPDSPFEGPRTTTPMTDAMTEREPGWDSATAPSSIAPAPVRRAPAPKVKAAPMTAPIAAAEPPVFERVEPAGPSWTRAAPKTLVDQIPGSSTPYVPPSAGLESTAKGRAMARNLATGRPIIRGITEMRADGGPIGGRSFPKKGC